MGNTNFEDLKCFIITPIGDELSNTRRKADGVIKSVLRPALNNVGFSNENIKAAHEIVHNGLITELIVTSIFEANLIICNLTDLNANVMYELALSHCLCKQVIHICEKGIKLPFDISSQNTIMYTDDMLGVEELSTRIIEIAKSLNYESDNLGNPILSSIKSSSIKNKLKKVEKSVEGTNDIAILASELRELRDKIDNIDRYNIEKTMYKNKNLYEIYESKRYRKNVLVNDISEYLQERGIYKFLINPNGNRVIITLNEDVNEDIIKDISKTIEYKYNITPIFIEKNSDKEVFI